MRPAKQSDRVTRPNMGVYRCFLGAEYRRPARWYNVKIIHFLLFLPNSLLATWISSATNPMPRKAHLNLNSTEYISCRSYFVQPDFIYFHSVIILLQVTSIVHIWVNVSKSIIWGNFLLAFNYITSSQFNSELVIMATMVIPPFTMNDYNHKLARCQTLFYWVSRLLTWWSAGTGEEPEGFTHNRIPLFITGMKSFIVAFNLGFHSLFVNA